MRPFRIAIFVIVCFFGFVTNAQEAQQILGLANETKEISYYEMQSRLWEKETRKNPHSGNAWWNYYKAKRAYYQKQDYSNWLNNREQVFAKLSPIINQVGKKLPNSFEYYYLKSTNTDDKKVAFQLLSRAYKINPQRTETYEDLFAHYMMHGQRDKAKVLAKKITDSNLYANAVYQWNLNSLNSAFKNSIVITTGDMDTLPRWVLQTGERIRPDVLVLNQWLLATQKEYEQDVFSKLEIAPFNKSQDDFSNKEDYKNAMLKYIINSVNISKKIHFDCGTDIKLFEKLGIKNKMYLTGINFTYSTQPIDNLSITKMNFEEVMHLDYLTSDFQIHPQNELVKTALNVSYIPGLMKLKKHYLKIGNKEEASRYTGLIDHIATESGNKKEILSWYAQ